MKTKRAFTIAEILITLVIVGLIAALGVPMLGQQKVKRRAESVTSHGTFECFYDQNGQLVQYIQDNRENRGGTRTVIEGRDHCTFTPPSASSYVVSLIGAGGNGGGFFDENFVPSYDNGDIVAEGDEGNIRLDNSFSSDMSSAPKWVRPMYSERLWQKQWDNGAIVPMVTIYSATGSGGWSVCKPAKKAVTQNEEYCDACVIQNSTCASDCYDLLHANGGNGGKGIKVKFQFKPTKLSGSIKVQKDTNSIYYGYMGDMVGVYSNSDNNGAAAKEVDGELVPGSNGVDFSEDKNISSLQNNKYFTIVSAEGERDGGSGGSGCSISMGGINGQQGAEPRIEFPEEIPYKRVSHSLLATYSLPGTNGNMQRKVFGRLPAGLRLTPGNSAVGDGASTVSVANAEGNFLNIMTSNGKTDGEMFRNVNLGLTSENIEQFYPFPNDQRFSVSDPNANLIFGAGDATAIGDLINRRDYVPGRAGYGGFPIILQLQTGEVCYIGKDAKGDLVKVKETDTTSRDYTNRFNNGYLCPGEVQPVLNASGQHYCAPTRGNNGAISISW